MLEQRHKTALIGFGQIGQAYSEDPVMARVIPYSTHAQVLSEHKAFSWDAVVDPLETNRRIAKERWQIDQVSSTLSTLENRRDIEVAIIASPPSNRLSVLSELPSLKAVLVEKPLALDFAAARQFIEECNRREILVQVNLLRRADVLTRSLAAGHLRELIGEIQLVSAVYGNGFKNNGTHIVDVIRMLIGEIVSVQAFNLSSAFVEGPIKNDLNFSLLVHTDTNLAVALQPIRFSFYRENCIELWGSTGKFRYMHGGATLLLHSVAPSRLSEKERELKEDESLVVKSTIGSALFEMYSNLSDALAGTSQLYSSGRSALVTTQVVNSAFESFDNGGYLVHVPLLN